jgi:glycosyltransferase involved in cell wall biosynthesis
MRFVCVFGENGPVAQRLAKRGIIVHIVPYMRSPINPFKDLLSYFYIAKFIYRYKPDLIHAHSTKAGMLSRIAAFQFGIPCVYSVHGWGWRGLGKISASLVLIIEKVLALTPRLKYVYVSQSVQEDALLKIGKVDAQIIYNGVVDVGLQADALGELQIFMPARVSNAKDHKTLIQAFERLNFPSRLLLCGAGTESLDFKKNVESWAPNRFEKIRLLGQRLDVADLLSESHIFALISNFEALPLSIIEAMSSSRGIVATDVGGVKELIINEETGLLIKKADVDSLVVAITRLSDSDFRRRLGEQARQCYLKSFTLDRMASEFSALYYEIGTECNKEINC